MIQTDGVTLDNAKDIALYDLGKMPTTFDFAAWVTIAKTSGAKQVHFVFEGHLATWKYPEYIAWKRFANIVLPTCMLSGLPYVIGRRVNGTQYPYLIGDVEKAYKRHGKIERLKSLQEPSRRGYVTITLRESFRNRYRNSNLPAWQKFAEYLEAQGKEVVIFPECELAPIDLIHRMQVYAGAEMNLGVNGGPMTLCLYSEAPYIMLNMCPPNDTGERTYDMEKLLKGCDFWHKQFSFARPDQRIVWEPDGYENIVRAYESVVDMRQAA